MDRNALYEMMHGDGTRDYERYLRTKQLFACQTPFELLCNDDELQFQIVHQTEELWMKLIAYTLLEIDEQIHDRRTNRVLTLFGRVHKIMRLMIDSLAVLETMSPRDYQEIRRHLGNGSGQESPGFRSLAQIVQPLWQSFEASYLHAQRLTAEQIYGSEYRHCDAYMVAECLAEYDELFQKFRYHHFQLIRRSIGLGARSLKGRPVQALEQGTRRELFPALWEVRDRMTDAWAGDHGVVREPLAKRSHGCTPVPTP
jgi:tryptophan 2,3-dioxygenase